MDMNPLREEYDKYNKTHTKITGKLLKLYRL